MAGIGIDIGSTATKAVVADPSGAIAFNLVIPTGFSEWKLPSRCVVRSLARASRRERCRW